MKQGDLVRIMFANTWFHGIVLEMLEPHGNSYRAFHPKYTVRMFCLDGKTQTFDVYTENDYEVISES